MSDLLHREIALLRQQVEERDETILQLREKLIGAFKLPDWVPGLSPHEEALLRLLVSRERVSNDMMAIAINADADTVYNMVRIYVRKLRVKLGPLGVQIVNEWGRGYHLDPASRERLSPPRAA